MVLSLLQKLVVFCKSGRVRQVWKIFISSRSSQDDHQRLKEYRILTMAYFSSFLRRGSTMDRAINYSSMDTATIFLFSALCRIPVSKEHESFQPDKCQT